MKPQLTASPRWGIAMKMRAVIVRTFPLVSTFSMQSLGKSLSPAIAVALISAGPSMDRPAISADRFAADVRVLSDDAMAGRQPGTPGYDRAAGYVKAEFERMGLVPPPTQASFYQRVPMTETTAGSASIAIEGSTRIVLNTSDQVIALPDNQGRSARVTARAVVAGYGIAAPEFGIDDYANVKVAGKIVVVRDGAPASLDRDAQSYFSMLRTKAREAARRGAVGLVILSGKTGAEFHQITAHHPRDWFSWRRADKEARAPESALRVMLLLSAEADAKLMAGEAGDIAGRQSFEMRQRLTLTQVNVTRLAESANVIGLLPGSDPVLAHEYVLMMAHLDHLGTDPNRAGDKIFNGAMDNAAGVATILAVARAFMNSERPRRSILFLATTGEETGFSGTDYFAHHLPVPAKALIGALNIDMPYLLFPLRGEGGGMFLYGDDHSDLGSRVAAAAARLDIAILPVPQVESTRFPNSDQAPLTELGIPALRMKPGYRLEDPLHRRQKVAAFREQHYHQVSDDVCQAIDYQAGADYAVVHYDLARDLADRTERPRWNPDSFLARRFANREAR